MLIWMTTWVLSSVCWDRWHEASLDAFFCFYVTQVRSRVTVQVASNRIFQYRKREWLYWKRPPFWIWPEFILFLLRYFSWCKKRLSCEDPNSVRPASSKLTYFRLQPRDVTRMELTSSVWVTLLTVTELLTWLSALVHQSFCGSINSSFEMRGVFYRSVKYQRGRGPLIPLKLCLY